MIVELDALAALHLAYAIERHNTARTNAGKDVPDALIALRHAATETYRSRGDLVVVPRPGSVRFPDTEADTDGTRPDDDPDELLTQREAAAVLDVSERTVRRWIDRGVLPARGPGRRVRRADLITSAARVRRPESLTHATVSREPAATSTARPAPTHFNQEKR